MKKLKFSWHGQRYDDARFYGDGTYDWGNVFKTSDGHWGASWGKGFETYKTRKEAMARVEREVAKLRRRKSR